MAQMDECRAKTLYYRNAYLLSIDRIDLAMNAGVVDTVQECSGKLTTNGDVQSRTELTYYGRFLHICPCIKAQYERLNGH